MEELKPVTVDEQLGYRTNFVSNGKLYLVYCANCHSENYSPAVASGQCAFCGWSDSPKGKE